MLKHKSRYLSWLAALAVVPVFAQQVPELNKLFTTPEERQVINANRYKDDRAAAPVISPSQPVEAEVIQDLVKEEVQLEYRISGVSTSPDGPATAWINGEAYESGELLEDGSKIKVRATAVVIVTPDGNSHRGLSGETLSVKYTKAADR